MRAEQRSAEGDRSHRPFTALVGKIAFAEVRRSDAFEGLAYTARKYPKTHAANATTQAVIAMIKMALSVVNPTPVSRVSGDPCRRRTGVQPERSL